MGGRLTVAIRRGNGTEYISGRWTNPLPHWLSNPKFWDDGTVVDDYIKAGLENNTPTDRVFPEEYGVVVIDFQTKRVFSRQDYCGIGHTNTTFLDAEGAANLLTIIEEGRVTRYDVFRHAPFDAPEDVREALHADHTLHPDEVEEFHAQVRRIATGPNPEDGDGYTGCKHFKPGMIVVEWSVPGWTFDDGKRYREGKVVNCAPRAWKCWSEVEAFIKETGWKSPCWTQTEVDAEYNATHDTDAEAEDEAGVDAEA